MMASAMIEFFMFMTPLYETFLTLKFPVRVANALRKRPARSRARPLKPGRRLKTKILWLDWA
jgi:hypothetical protein